MTILLVIIEKFHTSVNDILNFVALNTLIFVSSPSLSF